MSLSAFLAKNAVKVENMKFPVSNRFLSGEVNEEGKPLPELWEICCITSEEDEKLRQSCILQVPITGRRGQMQRDFDTGKYLGLLAVKCTVYPNLNDKELQDSYGVMCAADLVKVMLTPGEYTNYVEKIQEINGFDETFQDKVKEAKN